MKKRNSGRALSYALVFGIIFGASVWFTLELANNKNVGYSPEVNLKTNGDILVDNYKGDNGQNLFAGDCPDCDMNYEGDEYFTKTINIQEFDIGPAIGFDGGVNPEINRCKEIVKRKYSNQVSQTEGEVKTSCESRANYGVMCTAPCEGSSNNLCFPEEPIYNIRQYEREIPGCSGPSECTHNFCSGSIIVRYRIHIHESCDYYGECNAPPAD